jgi:hypothetical protein
MSMTKGTPASSQIISLEQQLAKREEAHLELCVKHEKLQAENALLREDLADAAEILKNILDDPDVCNVYKCHVDYDDVQLYHDVLNSTPETAKLQAVLEAAEAVEKDHGVMLLETIEDDNIWKLCEAVRELKGERSNDTR